MYVYVHGEASISGNADGISEMSWTVSHLRSILPHGRTIWFEVNVAGHLRLYLWRHSTATMVASA